MNEDDKQSFSDMADAVRALAPEPAPAVAAPMPADIPAHIERWLVDELQNSPVSRDTDVWNHVRQAVDRLKASLGSPSAPGGEG